METPIEYVDSDGSTVNSTIGELIENHSSYRNLPKDQVKTIIGALNNDPNATQALLQQQIDAIKAKAGGGDQTSQENEKIAALEAKIAQLETQGLAPAKRVVDAFEHQEIRATLANLLTSNQELQKAMPWLAADKSGTGIQKATQQIKALRDASRASGQNGQLSGEVISNVLGSINNEMERIASAFGGALSPNTQQQQQQVVMQQGQPARTDGVTPPRLTPQDIINASMNPNYMQNQNAAINPQQHGMVPPNVPQPGGQPGGQAPNSMEQNQPGAQQGQKFTAEQMRAALSQRRAQAEGFNQ
jgi:hypothetical protein